MIVLLILFFFKQKTAYEMRISDWSSDVCSSDLGLSGDQHLGRAEVSAYRRDRLPCPCRLQVGIRGGRFTPPGVISSGFIPVPPGIRGRGAGEDRKSGV